MIEFIDGPCGWNREAPARLRRQAAGGASAWREYSTSRFLHDLEPVVLHTTEDLCPRFPSDTQVELLPEAVAQGWRNPGLEFASVAEMNEAQFLQLLERSLDLIRTVPPLHGTVAGLCRSLHLLVASGRDVDVSYSDPGLPFSVFVSCPPSTERNRVERLAENIMHEALHLQLTLVETVETLVTRRTGEISVFSPWKHERRTVRGLVHAVYVFGNLRYFWQQVAAESPSYLSFAQARIETIRREMEAAMHLLASPGLTTMGRRLASSFLAPR